MLQAKGHALPHSVAEIYGWFGVLWLGVIWQTVTWSRACALPVSDDARPGMDTARHGDGHGDVLCRTGLLRPGDPVWFTRMNR